MPPHATSGGSRSGRAIRDPKSIPAKWRVRRSTSVSMNAPRFRCSNTHRGQWCSLRTRRFAAAHGHSTFLRSPKDRDPGLYGTLRGHIVTNFHVIYGADAITVTLADRTEHRARIVGLDPDHDLAVLQIKAPADALVPIPVGSSRDLRVGQKVLAIGNPFGLDHTLTTGVVSAVGRTIKSMTNRTIDGVIQTDAAINPGNSGGPLLESSGRLIGINTQIISPSGAYAGIGFAVPVDTVNRLVPELIKYGKVIRPGLGITFVPDEIAARLGVKGVVIGRVTGGGPAEAAGLRGLKESRSGAVAVGDVVTRLDGKPVGSLDDLLTILDHHAVGDTVLVEFLREGRRQQATVTLQAIE